MGWRLKAHFRVRRIVTQVAGSGEFIRRRLFSMLALALGPTTPRTYVRGYRESAANVASLVRAGTACLRLRWALQHPELTLEATRSLPRM